MVDGPYIGLLVAFGVGSKDGFVVGLDKGTKVGRILGMLVDKGRIDGSREGTFVNTVERTGLMIGAKLFIGTKEGRTLGILVIFVGRIVGIVAGFCVILSTDIVTAYISVAHCPPQVSEPIPPHGLLQVQALTEPVLNGQMPYLVETCISLEP